ncbi:AAA family ATPase [Treponema vincentii]|uniref:AAA family ATPase n=1 Tax=Treponema vincentii TaxID=69710 RepID=UPI0020A2BDCF|nr:AAA family ATPase [Treponema vincentii]
MNSKQLEDYKPLLMLLQALIVRLKKGTQAETIMQAFIQKGIKEKQLTVFTPGKNYNHPFEYGSKLDVNFKEDTKIAAAVDNFTTDSIFTINLCRCVFMQRENLAKIIALIFFSAKINNNDTYIIPQRINVSARITKILNDITPVEFLFDTLHLSHQEAVLLTAVYRTQTIYELYNFYDDVLYQNTENKMTIYAKCINTSLQAIRILFENDKKLISFGLMNKYDYGCIENESIYCIYNKNFDAFFSGTLKEEKANAAFNLNSYAIKKEHSSLALQFLKSNFPSNILLYGSPGAGKTEFAKTLAKESGLRLFMFKNELDTDRALQRLHCILSIPKKDTLFVIDEAENILKTIEPHFRMFMSTTEKGIVNKMLDNNINKVVWIVNYTDLLDISTLRRFTYSIKFNEMPKSLLKKIAQSKLQNSNISGKILHTLVDLCDNYRITGASIDNMIKAVNSVHCSSQTEEQIVIDVKNTLEANSGLIYGSSHAGRKIQKTYDIGALNTSIEPDDILTMIKNATAYADSAQTEVPAGIRMLFYGLSGTGKTEFARYIANSLAKELILKKASDILGKYVGESEQNIKEAFEEAERQDAILLFDEADSFFSNRFNAENAWKRTMVNEFLMQIEAFNGLLICTTNMRSIMDPALQRRFHIMVEFQALSANGIKTLLMKYFHNVSFNADQIEKLNQWQSVTPGDFNALYGKARFMPQEKITSEYIITELAQMQQEKNGVQKTIGFSIDA